MGPLVTSFVLLLGVGGLVWTTELLASKRITRRRDDRRSAVEALRCPRIHPLNEPSAS
jgi:hypothetical protein